MRFIVREYRTEHSDKEHRQTEKNISLCKEMVNISKLFKIIQSNIEPKLREMGGYNYSTGSLDNEPAAGLEPGDILGITSPAGYEHYAVYIGDERVIHFAAAEGDFGEAEIREAPLTDFLDGQREFFVLDFSAVGKRPVKKDHGSPSVLTPLHEVGAKVIKDAVSDALSDPDDAEITHIFTAEETVARARSVIGANEHSFERDYDLLFNNCEHFAIWCKTGVRKSYQVENILKLLTPDMRYYI